MVIFAYLPKSLILIHTAASEVNTFTLCIQVVFFFSLHACGVYLYLSAV